MQKNKYINFLQKFLFLFILLIGVTASSQNIDSLKVLGNALAISKVDSLTLVDEFNQVKGKLMTVYYEGKDIKEIKVIGNAQAITFADEENKTTKILL